MSEADTPLSGPIACPKEKRVCVFAHFDRDGLVDDHVYHLLKQLQGYVGHIEFVTTAGIGASDLARLAEMNVRVLSRPNEGYDFYSYKLGIARVDMSDVQELVICNDSIYGPLYSLGETFDYFSNVECDFWGISSSKELARHVQSYFVVFRRKVIGDSVFQNFWSGVALLESKAEIIRSYEVGLSQVLFSGGYRMRALVEAGGDESRQRFIGSLPLYWRALRKKLKSKSFYNSIYGAIKSGAGIHLNPVQYQWRENIVRGRVPFIKVELLRDNPLGVSEREAVIETIEQNTSYPVSLIRAHLSRICR